MHYLSSLLFGEKSVFNLSIMLGKVLFYVGQGFCFEMKKKKEKQTQKTQTQKHSL